jgi:hypothetical protein
MGEETTQDTPEQVRKKPLQESVKQKLESDEFKEAVKLLKKQLGVDGGGD